MTKGISALKAEGAKVHLAYDIRVLHKGEAQIWQLRTYCMLGTLRRELPEMLRSGDWMVSTFFTPEVMGVTFNTNTLQVYDSIIISSKTFKNIYLIMLEI